MSAVGLVSIGGIGSLIIRDRETIGGRIRKRGPLSCDEESKGYEGEVGDYEPVSHYSRVAQRGSRGSEENFKPP